MLQNISPIAQATLGTVFTWGLTAAGSAMVIVFHSTQRKLLDASLGFAAGVMIAASYWSLLAPAIEMAEESKDYGDKGEFAFLPVSIGFVVGGLFVYLTDVLISSFGLCAPHLLLAMEKDVKRQMKKNDYDTQERPLSRQPGLPLEDFYERTPSRRRGLESGAASDTRFNMPSTPPRPYTVFSTSDPTSLNYHQPALDNTPRTRFQSTVVPDMTDACSHSGTSKTDNGGGDQWKRIVLLIVAITVHNIPEGLAVGVGFGAVGSSTSATFENARNLAIGIGIQNFPEGLAVSLPLRAAGFSLWRSFWYGQLSGMVEPMFGILGAVAVSLARPLLPYALAFAAGAMIYVVVDDIIPEAHSCDNGRLATGGVILGFTVMMILDVGLG